MEARIDAVALLQQRPSNRPVPGQWLMWVASTTCRDLNQLGVAKHAATLRPARQMDVMHRVKGFGRRAGDSPRQVIKLPVCQQPIAGPPMGYVGAGCISR